MKKIYTVLSFLALSAVFVSCSDDSEIFSAAESTPSYTAEITFPQADGSTELTGSVCVKARNLLNAIGPDFAKGLGAVTIEPAQIEEIKVFTDELVAGCTTELEKLKKIYTYVGDNVEYEYNGYVDNSAYAVFKNKRAICQGYSNLLKVMCYTQDIPAFVANGQVVWGGTYGHAWNYAYADGKWYVCDATNKRTIGGGPFVVTGISSYSHLEVWSFDAPIHEDENFVYTYEDSEINVSAVKSNATRVVTPYSVCGFTITSFNPRKMFPDNVKELIIGSNIKTLGRENYIIGVSQYANNVETIEIDPENEYYESFSNVIYQVNLSSYNLVCIAPGAKDVELKPIQSFGKEVSIKGHKNLETIVFVPGTLYIDDWSIEDCPKLHTAYIPQNTQVSSNAFVKVAGNFKIVRGDYTNIPQIKMD